MATRAYARTAMLTTTEARQQRHPLAHRRCETTAMTRAYVAAAGAPLTNIDVKELAELLETAEDEGGQLTVSCDFCNETYVFDAEQIRALYVDEAPST